MSALPKFSPIGCGVIPVSRLSFAIVPVRMPRVVVRVHLTPFRSPTASILSANVSAALDEVLRSRRRRVEYVVAAEPNVDAVVLSRLPPPTPISRVKQYSLEVRAQR